MFGKKVAIVDRDTKAREYLKTCLTNEGFSIFTFESAHKAHEFINVNQIDIVLSEWYLSDIDGLEFCRIMKRDQITEDVPIIMVSSKNDEIDVVTALEMGFDDYMVKPFRIKEMVSRIKKCLKKKKPSIGLFGKDYSEVVKVENNEIIVYKDLKIDIPSYQAQIGSETLNLTYSEFKILVLLAKMPGRIFSRGEIIEMVSGVDCAVTERAVDVQVVGLRKKLGNYKQCIQTVRSLGYKFIN